MLVAMGVSERVIAVYLPCVTCGYFLYLQPVGGRCPKCGTAVQQSVGPVTGGAGRRLVPLCGTLGALFWTGAAVPGVLILWPVLEKASPYLIDLYLPWILFLAVTFAVAHGIAAWAAGTLSPSPRFERVLLRGSGLMTLGGCGAAAWAVYGARLFAEDDPGAWVVASGLMVGFPWYCLAAAWQVRRLARTAARPVLGAVALVAGLAAASGILFYLPVALSNALNARYSLGSAIRMMEFPEPVVWACLAVHAAGVVGLFAVLWLVRWRLVQFIPFTKVAGQNRLFTWRAVQEADASGAGSVSTDLAADRLVDIDLPCMTCGYLLRMQPEFGRCPECQCPVSASIAASPAREGTRRLARLRAATSWMFWTGVSLFLLPPLSVVLVLVELQYAAVIYSCIGIVLCLLFGLNVTAAWVFSARARGGDLAFGTVAMRWTSVLGFCGVACAEAGMFAEGQGWHLGGNSQWVTAYVAGLCLLVVVPFYVVLVGQELAARAGAAGWTGLRAWAAISGWIVGGVYLALWCLFIGYAAAGRLSAAWWIALLLGWGTTLALVAFAGQIVTLLVLLRRFLRRTRAHVPLAGAFDRGAVLAAPPAAAVMG
jgi:hypothetical protein